MSNIHSVHQPSNSGNKGNYNPYVNEGFAPVYSDSQTQLNSVTTSVKNMWSISKKRFSFWILIIQLVYFIISYIINYSQEEPWNCTLLFLGAKYKPRIQSRFELHRLFFPIFLHGDLTHFFVNAVSQIIMNFFLEKQYGTKKLSLLFIISGIGGNLMSCIEYPDNISVGASSAIFGSLALYGGFLLTDTTAERNSRRINMIFYILILISNFSMIVNKSDADSNVNIDFGAHLGFLGKNYKNILL